MLVTIGSPTRDREISARKEFLHADNSPAKVPCTISESWGGGVVNISRAIAALGWGVMPVVMVGNDVLGAEAVQDLAGEFTAIRPVPCLAATRQSVLFPGGRVFTVLAQRTESLLSPALTAELRSAAAVVIAPLPAADGELIAELATTATRAIWLPSVEQVRDLPGTVKLSNRVAWTILNDAEGEILTGKSHPEDAIRELREAGLRSGIVVTSRLGALAWAPTGGHAFAPALGQGGVVRTVGPGDTFAAAFTVALCAEQSSVQNALAAGQLAAGRFVRGLPPLGTLDALLAWGKRQPTVDLAASRRASSRRIRWELAGAIGTAAAATILLSVRYWQ